MLKKTRFFIAATLMFLISVSSLMAQAPQPKNAERLMSGQKLTRQLRKFYFDRDYRGGYELGKRQAARFPENDELQAWFILNTAQNGMSRSVISSARQWTERSQNSAWAWFALGQALILSAQSKEAELPISRALELQPNNEEFIFARAAYLLARKKYPELSAWLDKNSGQIRDQSRLLIVKAEALYQESAGDKDSAAKRKQSLEMFAKAVAIAPNSFPALFFYGSYLNQEKRIDEALPLLRKAAQLSPRSEEARIE